jgi:orotidine-5'-phosphate decarboxylase
MDSRRWKKEHDMDYRSMLKMSAEMTRSILCLGLDPLPEALPGPYNMQGIAGALPFFERLFSDFEERKVYPGAFKANLSFFACHDRPLENDFSGSRTLASLIRGIKWRFPHIPVILDFKRGDIAASSVNYAHEGFVSWGAHGVTVSPFMGSDSVAPFLDFCSDEGEKGVYLLNRNSNEGSKDFQNLDVIENGKKKPLYMAIAEKIALWARGRPGLGAVIAATSPSELSDIACFYAPLGIPLLIPGVGAQGGSAEETIARLRQAGYDLSMVRINSSSGITHPWHRAGERAPEGWPEVCLGEMERLIRALNFS